MVSAGMKLRRDVTLIFAEVARSMPDLVGWHARLTSYQILVQSIHHFHVISINFESPNFRVLDDSFLLYALR